MKTRRNVIATVVGLATIAVAGATAIRYQRSTYAATIESETRSLAGLWIDATIGLVHPGQPVGLVYAAQTTSAQRVDVDRLGPQVGEVVPDFSAPDQFARTQTLKSVMGPNGAMLFFNRSADW